MDGRLVFWLAVYSFATFIRVSKGQYPGCLEIPLVRKERNLSIPDARYTASSYYKIPNKPSDDRYVPHNAKLYGNYGWAPEDNDDPTDYLQIDLRTPRVITAVATQGNGGNPDSKTYKKILEWVKTYKLNYANDTASKWTDYEENHGNIKIFSGNTDRGNVTRHKLNKPITARYIRFIPVKYENHKTMRVNVYFKPLLSLHVRSTERSIVLSWTISNCQSITAFMVRVGNVTRKARNESRSYTWTKLYPYTEYNVSVKAEIQNGYAYEVWSHVKNIKTLIAVPEEAPTSVSARPVTSRSIVLKWKMNRDKINGPFKGYSIFCTPQGGKTKMIDVGDVTTYNLTSLLKYTNYIITVAVRNAMYTGPRSTEQRVTTMEDVPEEAPTFVSARPVTSRSIVLKWKMNRDKINGPFKGYRIFCTPQGGKTEIIDVGDITTYNLTSLVKPYTNYTITVAVRNAMYTGPRSTKQRVTTMEDAPSVPRNIDAILTPARGLRRPRVVITWDTPHDLNGIIRKYTIVYYFNNDKPNKVVVSISAGKTNSFKYNVTAMSSGTFRYKISASTIKEGNYTDEKSIAILEYRCLEIPLVGKKRNLSIPDSSYTASSYFTSYGCDKDARYKPHNAKLHGNYGWAPKDSKNRDDYLQIDLGTPRVIAAVATQGSGNKSQWVKKYKLYYKSQKLLNYSGGKEFIGNTDASSVVRHDLENPVTARYIKFVPTGFHRHKTMRVNVYVSSQEAPRIVLLEVKERSFHVSWSVKLCSPTNLITGYEIKIADKTINTSSLEDTHREPNLKPYTEYNVSVRAIKQQEGYGAWSNITTIRTAIAAPELVPEIHSVKAEQRRSITVTWKKIDRQKLNGPFKGYRITYTPQGGNPEKIDVGDVTTYTLTSLLKYTTYSITVAVSNTKYTVRSRGERSVRTMEDTPDKSPVVTSIKAQSSDSILLKWKKVDPDKMNGVFKAYRITYTPEGGKPNIIDVGDITTYTLRSLLKYTTYRVTIAVMNEKFVGPPSKEWVMRTFEDAPSAPVNVNGTLTPDQDSFGSLAVITWERPLFPNGIIRKYTLIYYYNSNTSNEEIVRINETSDLQYIVNVTGSEAQVMSFKISATTIKEGPYQSGHDITLTSDANSSGRKGTSNGQRINKAKSGLVAVLVVGILLILFFLILVFAIWKRKRNHMQSQRYEAAEPLPLELVDDSLSSTTVNTNIVNIYQDPSVNTNIVNIYQETTPELVPSISSTDMERQRLSRRSSSRSASVKPMKPPVEFPAPDTNKLKKEFKSTPVAPKFDCKEGSKSANKEKNRYKNIIAYDHSLVTLEWVYGETESFYINANYIHGYDGTAEVYIATQGPMENTLDDFWRMIWEQKVTSIVMLTNLKEIGKIKCYRYWPDNCDQYSDITVITHKTEVFADFTIRTFFLSKVGSSNRRVRQFHFTAWPDKGVPDHATAVLSFRRKVLALTSCDGSNPTVIHCSAGVGRTGAYIMIDAMLRQAEEQQRVDVLNYLKTTRNDRPYMVQTVEQYIFVNMAIYDALTCGNTEVPVQNLVYAIQQLSIVDRRQKLTGYFMEFKRLEDVTSEDTQSGNFDVGLSRKNAKKNRYPNIIAANANRVILSTDNDTEIGDYINFSVIEAYKERKGDYINASFVDTYREHNAFIMTQAPMENTIADFWRMVMDYKIGTIVMLNNLQEEFETFPQYWPLHETKTYDGTKVRLVETKHLAGNIILRILEVSNRRKQLMVNHLQHLTWQNKCVPTNPQSVLRLLHEVQKSQQKSGNSPIVVHCNNGVGRSGTFCAIASCLERVKQEQVLDVFQTIKSIRVNRPGAVETLTQYVFCYNIIQNYLESFRDYANFGDI